MRETITVFILLLLSMVLATFIILGVQQWAKEYQKHPLELYQRIPLFEIRSYNEQLNVN